MWPKVLCSGNEKEAEVIEEASLGLAKKRSYYTLSIIQSICSEQMTVLTASNLCLDEDYKIVVKALVALKCGIQILDLCRLSRKVVILMDNSHSSCPLDFALEKTKTKSLQCILVLPGFLTKLVKRLV